MRVLQTERLQLRWLSMEDAEFILELVNEPSWIRFIGDRGVRTLDHARDYISNGPMAMYARYGFGLYLTELIQESTPIGICGLIKRDTLDDVDIGFAFLPRYWSKGYAYEAAGATLEFAKTILGLKRVVAITAVDNERSVKLLEKLGMRFEKIITHQDDSEQIRLFAKSL